MPQGPVTSGDLAAAAFTLQTSEKNSSRGYKAPSTYTTMPNRRSAALLLLFGSALFAGLLFSNGHHNNNRKRRRLSRKLLEAGETVPVHPQCARGNPDKLVDRPLLLYKYSRTGSTWLAWSGKTLRATTRPMIWTHEAQKCIKKDSAETDKADELSTWYAEYFGRETDGSVISLDNKSGMSLDCLITAGKKQKRMGSLIATTNPHESHAETPDFTPEQWRRIFDAAPNLTLGVLNRIARSTGNLWNQETHGKRGLYKGFAKEDHGECR